jgi:hypothetical protein
MRWFKPEFPVMNVTCDPDRHIKLNRLAILGTPAHSTCEPGRERQREFKLCDIAVCTARHSKDFRKRAVELLDAPYIPSASKDTTKSTSWLFSTGLISSKSASRVEY